MQRILNLTPSTLFGDVRLLRLRFRIRIDGGGEARLPPYLGSAWRGLIGWEIKRICCPEESGTSCAPCAARDYCPYFLLFERKSMLPGREQSPRGYILYPPPLQSERGQDLYLTLIGSHTKQLPLFIKAISGGRKTGLGAARVAYRITGLEELRPDGTSAPVTGEPGALASLVEGVPLREWLERATRPPESYRLRFATPVRLRRKGIYLRGLDWPFLLGTLYRRLEAAARLFSDAPPLGKERWMDFQHGVETLAPAGHDLRWKDLARYSNRQGRQVPMGGLVGNVDVADPSGLLYPWWIAASILHVGKGASMGLGKVEILTNPSSERVGVPDCGSVAHPCQKAEVHRSS